MKTLKQIREASGGKEAYQKFFNSLLKKFGVKSPAELDDAKKKEFYDAIDKGWEGDNEKPEKNERYDDPDNLDPETTVDSDEDMADKAASQINASYGKMNASKKKKKMNASYHKEDVSEATKLKAGRGKAELDINWDGDRKDIKFATTKYKIKMKPHSDGAFISGDKAKLLAYLQGQDYAMDPEDIEDLYPELMESNYPKPLSIIRQVKEFSGDAETVRRKKRRFEKMSMCEHCGKMHEEGACMETDNDLDPETKGMEEANRLSIKLKGDASKLFDLAKKQGIKNKAHGDKEWNKAVDQAAAEMGKKVNFKDIAAVKQAMMHESVTEAKTVKLNRPEKNIFDLAMKAIARSHDAAKARTKRGVEKYMDWEGMDLIDDITGVSLNDDEKNNVYNAVRDALNAKTRESVKEVKIGKTIRGAKLGKPYPVLDAGTQRKVKAIAKKHSGNMQRALKDIEKLKKGLGDNPDVMDILRRANEEIEERVDVDGRLIGFKSAQRRSEGEKQKGKVIVDRRTKGYKEAKVRSEKAKAKRLEAKKQKEFAEKYPKLDYAYGDAAELRKTMEAASKVLMGKREASIIKNPITNETAANNVGDGNVDMNTTGKSKKKKELMAKRGY